MPLMKFRKLKQKSKNKKQQEKSIEYATYTSRIKAFIVDLFMIYAPILYVITYIFMGGKDAFLSSNLAPFVGVSTYALIYAILVSKSGQTPGKKAYEIKIVDEATLQNISFIRALYRYIMFLVSTTTLFGALIPLYRQDRKGLHDIVCKTVVINLCSDSKD